MLPARSRVWLHDAFQRKDAAGPAIPFEFSDLPLRWSDRSPSRTRPGAREGVQITKPLQRDVRRERLRNVPLPFLDACGGGRCGYPVIIHHRFHRISTAPGLEHHRIRKSNGVGSKETIVEDSILIGPTSVHMPWTTHPPESGYR